MSAPLKAQLVHDDWQRSKYLTFANDPRAEKGLKTEVVRVSSKSSGTMLGTIKWYGPWRCYVFYPAVGTLFNAVCLREIVSKCSSMMTVRRLNAGMQKP